MQEKRRKALFDELGLENKDQKYKSKQKRKYERKSRRNKYRIEAVDNEEYEERERKKGSCLVLIGTKEISSRVMQ